MARSSQLRKGSSGGGDGAFDVLWSVRKRWKPGLELRGRGIDAAREQLTAPCRMGLQVACARVLEAAHGTVGEEDRKQARNIDDLDGSPGGGGGRAQAAGELIGKRGEA
jgi:hypothetical protein